MWERGEHRRPPHQFVVHQCRCFRFLFQFYGTPCSANAGVRTENCRNGAQCNVNVTLYIESTVTSLYCNDGDYPERNLLQRIMMQENFCKVKDLNNVFEIPGFVNCRDLGPGYECEKHAFYVRTIEFRVFRK